MRDGGRGVFIIGPGDETNIRFALAKARSHFIPLEKVQAVCKDVPQDKAFIKVADCSRESLAFADRAAEQVMLPLNWRLAITVEEQPCGMCAHLSLSREGAKPGTVPHPAALQMTAQACGFEGPPIHAWLEEYLVNDEVGGIAVNGLWLMTPVGHA